MRRRGIHNSNLIGNIACVKVCGSGRVLRRCVRRRCVMGGGVRVGRGGRVRAREGWVSARKEVMRSKGERERREKQKEIIIKYLS